MNLSRSLFGPASAALVVLLSAVSAHASDDTYPSLQPNSKVMPGPDGNAGHAGVLAKAFCFVNPTRVCVPAGSTVHFTSSTPGPHANQGTPRVTTVSLQAVDAPTAFKAFGLTFAAHAPSPQRDDDDHDTPNTSLEFRGADVRGFLGQPLTLGGQSIAAGPVDLRLDEKWVPETILRGVAAKDFVLGGWRVPAGTWLDLRGAPTGFTLKPRAGTRLTRATADEYPPSATSVEHGEAWGVVLTTVEGCPTFEVNGLTLSGRISLARHGSTGPWEIAAGTLARASKLGEVALPAGAEVMLCGAALERVSAPEGKHLTVAGHATGSLSAEHERPGSVTAPWVDACSRGKVTGYSIPLEGCPPKVYGAQLDAEFGPRDEASASALEQCKVR